MNQTVPKQEQLREFFGSGEDGPFVMVNLLKFKERAEYADGRETDLTGAQAYAIYGTGVHKCITAVRGKKTHSAIRLPRQTMSNWAGNSRPRTCFIEGTLDSQRRSGPDRSARVLGQTARRSATGDQQGTSADI